MNRVSPKALLHSKWTKVEVINKEKHFVVTKVCFDEEQRVTSCTIEAVINQHHYPIHWRDLKDSERWKTGWK